MAATSAPISSHAAISSARLLPTIGDVRAARERIKGHIVATPLMEHPALNRASGGRILFKCENMQSVGAFKMRGAYNACSQVDRAKYPGGVVACSSGNHAQGVAAAATLLGLKSIIVMPADAPALKLARTRAFGADVHTYDRVREDREEIARRLCAERKAALVHPFDDFHVMAGQGTTGLEIMEQAAQQGLTPDAVLAPCSGGGLVGGISIAVKAANPATEVYAVEPAGFDDLARSLASGRIETNAKLSGSICDALLAASPGKITFAVCKQNLSGSLVVTDDEARQAIRFAFHELKQVLEPGGAVALAAVLTGKVSTKGRTVAVVLSGGNIDPRQFAEIIGT